MYELENEIQAEKKEEEEGGKFVVVQEIPFPTKIQDDLRVETDGP